MYFQSFASNYYILVICSFSECEKTEDNQCCHFPYLHKDKEFNVCAKTADGDKFWCSLTYNYDKDQQWGYCKGIMPVTDK